MSFPHSSPIQQRPLELVLCARRPRLQETQDFRHLPKGGQVQHASSPNFFREDLCLKRPQSDGGAEPKGHHCCRRAFSDVAVYWERKSPLTDKNLPLFLESTTARPAARTHRHRTVSRPTVQGSDFHSDRCQRSMSYRRKTGYKRTSNPSDLSQPTHLLSVQAVQHVYQ